MQIWIIALVGGVVSGFLSSFPVYLLFFNPIPGFCFGLLFLFVLKHLAKGYGDLWRKIVFVIVSMGAYFGAFWSTIYSVDVVSHQCVALGISCKNGGFFIGGVVGALVLILGVKFIFKIFTMAQAGILIISSGILGVLGAVVSQSAVQDVISQSFGFFRRDGLLLLFVVWQVGMILLMTYFLKRNSEPPINL